MTKRTPNLIVVCGPTASGKTRLSVAVARDLATEIISADSRQVYRGMDIGTGKDLGEYATTGGAVPVRLIDIVDPREVYSVHHFQRDFNSAFSEIASRGLVPVMAGGTGLYIEAALKQYGIPNVPGDETGRARMMARDKADLERELLGADPELAAHTDLSSKQRIVRALEVVRFAGEAPLTRGPGPGPSLRPVVLCVSPPRPELYRRIGERLRARLSEGMVEEVAGLRGQGVSDSRLERFGLEYRHVTRYLRGDLGYEEMVEVLEREIRHLAKRQLTWFRGMERRGTPMHWLASADPASALQIIYDSGLRPSSESDAV